MYATCFTHRTFSILIALIILKVYLSCDWPSTLFTCLPHTQTISLFIFTLKMPQSFIYINSFEFRISNLVLCWWPYSPVFHYCVHKILTLVPILSQIISSHAVFLPVTSVLILSCIPLLGLQNNLFCIGILTKLYQQFYSLFTSYISSSLVSLSLYCVKFMWISVYWH